MGQETSKYCKISVPLSRVRMKVRSSKRKGWEKSWYSCTFKR